MLKKMTHFEADLYKSRESELMSIRSKASNHTFPHTQKHPQMWQQGVNYAH